MQTVQKLSLVLVIQALMIPASFAHEQTSGHAFLEDTHANLTLRNAWIGRDKKDPGVKDQSSWGQAFIFDLDTGYTPGIIGFGAGLVGDVGFKLGDNKHHGNDMLPFDQNADKGLYPNGKPHDSWARGGANVKAKISNTTVRYGTQVVDLPVLQSNTSARLLPEYYTGTYINSQEIEGLDLSAGYFTKDQYSTNISTDGRHLKRAVVWGGKYKFNDQFKFGYYGADLKDALNRQYINANFVQPLDKDQSLNFDLSAYHTKYEKGISYSTTGDPDEKKRNTIWALASSYNTGPHNVMLAYQQNSGNSGYAYNVAADGGGTIYMPNSYLSDFVGNGEKSAQIQYSLDFGKLGVLPGLNWTTAYVYGWDINVQKGNVKVTDDAREREFFNQVSYKVQSGAAKDLSLKVRNSIYRADQAYNSDVYIGSTNEWRIFVEYPWALF